MDVVKSVFKLSDFNGYSNACVSIEKIQVTPYNYPDPRNTTYIRVHIYGSLSARMNKQVPPLYKEEQYIELEEGQQKETLLGNIFQSVKDKLKEIYGPENCSEYTSQEVLEATPQEEQ